MTYPILADFPIVHKKLLDLLGVRYLVQPAARPPEHMDQWRAVEEDAHPQAFDFIAGGVRPLPPYTVGENRTALPRTFVVFHTAPLPARPDILPRLLATDFRQEVLLESDPAPSVTVVEGMTRRADIRRYEPNRVVVDVPEGPAGWLVLADLWYPGWTCRVDDMPVTVERANYLFRAVAVPEGRHEIVFAFEPASYRLGQRISLSALVGLSAFVILAALRLTASRERQRPELSSVADAPGSSNSSSHYSRLKSLVWLPPVTV